MTEAGCYTADCTYTGPMSGATPGECTDTAGYLSNYEIEQIIAGGGVQQYSSDDGDILVYNQTQWVSWMNPSTYWDRLAWVQGLNFGGTSDWAMDLNQTFADADASNIVYISPDIWSEPDPTVACYPPCTFVFPPWSLSTPTTISRPPVTMTLEETWPLIESLNGNITTTGYTTGTTVTTITLPPVTTDLIQVWNYEWTDTEIVTVYITSSVPFPPILLTEDSPPTQTQISTGTPFWYTYSPDPYPPYTGPSQTSSPTSIIPPPPPPPGSPGSVHVTQGPPSPTPGRATTRRTDTSALRIVFRNPRASSVAALAQAVGVEATVSVVDAAVEVDPTEEATTRTVVPPRTLPISAPSTSAATPARAWTAPRPLLRYSLLPWTHGIHSLTMLDCLPNHHCLRGPGHNHNNNHHHQLSRLYPGPAGARLHHHGPRPLQYPDMDHPRRGHDYHRGPSIPNTLVHLLRLLRGGPRPGNHQPVLRLFRVDLRTLLQYDCHSAQQLRLHHTSHQHCRGDNLDGNHNRHGHLFGLHSCRSIRDMHFPP